eukprot:450694_1
MKLYFHLSKQPTKSVAVEIDVMSLTIDQLIEIGIKVLPIANHRNEMKIYHQSGEEITNINSISNEDHIFVSYCNAKCSSNSANQSDSIYVSIVGKDGIGKSALTLQYVQGQFVADYDPVIEDAYRKRAHIDGKLLMVDIHDTVDMVEDFTPYRTSWVRDKDGCFLIFDITNRQSFDYLHTHYECLQEVYEGNMPIYLVGNKLDLAGISNIHNIQQIHFIVANWFRRCMDINIVFPLDVNNIIVDYCPLTQREVTYEDAYKRATEWNALGYVEVSAKTGINVNNMFGDFLRKIIAQQSEMNEHDGKMRQARRCCIV